MNKKFLLIGGYSCKNPGDEAILKSTIYKINDICPQSTFYIWTDQEQFTISFDRDIKFEIIYWKLFPHISENQFFLKIIRRIYKEFFPYLKDSILPSYIDRKLKKVILDCDLVISVGGGYLTSLYSVRDINYLVNVAKRFHKPFYLIGQTIGPFTHKNDKKMADEIFQYAEQIVVRDSDSLSEVTEYKNKVVLSSDHAISFLPDYKAIKNVRNLYLLPKSNAGQDVLNIGINLRIWKDSRDKYPIISKAIHEINKLAGVRVRFIFIPMEVSAHCDDREEGMLFSKQMSSDVDFVVIKNELSVEETHSIISSLDFFIGMRLHSLVFALSSAVPCIGIYYGDYYKRKIDGLFEVFNNLRFSLDLLEVERLASKFVELRSLRNEIKVQLELRTSDVKKEQQIVFNKIVGE